MAIVQTVTGPIDTADMGTVLSHEHVALFTLGLWENYPDATIPRQDVVEICVRNFEKLKRLGVNTLVDHTTFDVGRDIHLLQEVSRRTGVNIVACTGILVTIPRWFHRHSVEAMAAVFIKELQQGVADTGIRTGVIKCALDKGGLPEHTERVLRACARASVATGIPVSTHSWPGGQTGLVLQRILSEEGVEPHKILMGHCGDSEDYDYLHNFLDAGNYLGMDRFGCEDYLADAKRMAVVVALCKQGYTEQLMLSQDANSWSDRDIDLPVSPLRANWNYFHLHDHIVPALRDAGLADEQLHLLTGGNAARFFGATH